MRKLRPIYSLNLRGLLKAAGVLVCLATLLGFLGRFSWLLDLFSHFRVQYLLTLALISTFLLLLRNHKSAAALLLFAAINLGVVLPLYTGGHPPSTETIEPVRAMMLNVNTKLGNPERVRAEVQRVNPDILVLEEISQEWTNGFQWLEKSHPYSRTEPRDDNFGIGLFSKFPIEKGEVTYIGGAGVPSIVAVINTGASKLYVLATHPPPPAGPDYSAWRNNQLERLPLYLKSDHPVLLIGDLNTTPWNYYFKRLLSESGLINSANGHGIQPSWPNFTPLLRIPIDHMLHSKEISIVDRTIGEDVGSDHYPVIVDFVFNQPSS